MEVRFAVIADGPFKTPEGYNLCSMAAYIHYNPALATKPFLLLLPHWSGAPDHPVFVISPHTLRVGEQYYPFRLLEGGEFGDGYGIVRWTGTAPCLERPTIWRTPAGTTPHCERERRGTSCIQRWQSPLSPMTGSG